jgi:hypothetical protein
MMQQEVATAAALAATKCNGKNPTAFKFGVYFLQQLML